MKGYTEWTEWNMCTVTCGTGFRERTRECVSKDEKYCSGPNVETSLCGPDCEREEDKELSNNVYNLVY